MEINYQCSFTNGLARIINSFGSQTRFGLSVAEAIAEKVKQVCSELDLISSTPDRDLFGLIKSKFSDTKIFPKSYTDNGCVSCHDLFFESRHEIKGVFVAFGFYLPFLFKTPAQRKELRLFTTDCGRKLSNPQYVELYFVVAEVVEAP